MAHQEQLLKLTQLAPQPPDVSFLLGYLSYPLRRETAIALKPPVKRMLAHFEEGLISAINVLQMMAVLKLEVIPSAKKGKDSEEGGRIMTQMMTLLGELICDNNYLHWRYFEQRVPEGKAEDSLGVQCPICTVQISPMEVCYLSCSHMYHRFCFEGYAKQKIGSKIFPLRCPSGQCNVELLTQQLNEYLSRQVREKYDEFMFQNYVELHNADTSWCPTPGCQAVFSFDGALDNYRCPSCKQHYCLRCKCQMHANLTCKQYRQLAKMDEPDRQFMMLVKGARFKQCPNCKFWVEKNQGCDHMTCRCKYQFCYVCGGKYGACRCNGSALEEPEDQEDLVDLIGIPPPPPPPPEIDLPELLPPPPPPLVPSLPSLIQMRPPPLASIPPVRPLRIQSVSPAKSPQVSQRLVPPPSIGLSAAQVRQRWQRKQQFQPKRQRKLYVFGRSQRKPIEVQKEERLNIQEIDMERKKLKEPLIAQIKQEKMDIQPLKQGIQAQKKKSYVSKSNQISKWQQMFYKMHKLESKLQFLNSNARRQKQQPQG